MRILVALLLVVAFVSLYMSPAEDANVVHNEVIIIQAERNFATLAFGPDVISFEVYLRDQAGHEIAHSSIPANECKHVNGCRFYRLALPGNQGPCKLYVSGLFPAHLVRRGWEVIDAESDDIR